MQTVVRDGDSSTFAVCFASLDDDDGVRLAWMDGILGTFGERAPQDHITFGCRVSPGGDSRGPVISAVDAALAFTYRPVMGQRLTRAEALGHPRIEDFWAIVDLVLMGDASVRSYVYAEG